MHPQHSLEALPIEVFLNIADSLTTHDLAQLSYTSKNLSAVVEPLIWTDVELHGDAYHESRVGLHHPPPFRAPSERRHNGFNTQRKATKFFTMLLSLHKNDIERLRAVTGRVRHLCTVIEVHWSRYGRQDNSTVDPDTISVWNLIPFFSNLETLELHGWHLGWESCEEITAAPPANLRFAKLWSYIPRKMAAWVLGAGPTLERLDIGMLDRPISSPDNDNSRPLPEEKLADGEYGSDYGSLSAEAVIPRPLGGFISHSSDSEASELTMPQLKHLHLCQPAKSSSDLVDYGWSSRAEEACYKDWRALLLASSGALEVLVVEQRPAAEYIESDGYPEIEFMEEHRGDHESLIRMLQNTINKGGAYDGLKTVFLYGMDVGVGSNGESTHTTPASDFMGALKSRGISSEARLGSWCFFDCDPGETHWATWNAPDDSEDEEGDDRGGDDEGSPKLKWDTLLAKH